MDPNTRDWQEEGGEDIQLPAEIDDPLAQLAVELALAYEAVEHSIGSFCSACTCQLGYHLTSDDLSCETCGCTDIYWFCVRCGKSRPAESYTIGSKECKFCVNIPPVRIKPFDQAPQRPYFLDMAPTHYEKRNRDRDREARLVLLELTE